MSRVGKTLRRDICQALGDNGEKCKREATNSHNYHGTSQLYDEFNGRPTWARIRFCDKHGKDMPK